MMLMNPHNLLALRYYEEHGASSLNGYVIEGPGRIAKVVGGDRATLGDAIARLEAAGYLERSPDTPPPPYPVPRRITEKGVEVRNEWRERLFGDLL